MEQDIADYRHLDCSSIEWELQYQNTLLREAQEDGIEAIGTGVFINEDLGDIDHEIALNDEKEALARIDALRKLSAECQI